MESNPSTDLLSLRNRSSADEAHVFARLRPCNDESRRAFDELVKMIIESQGKFEHLRKFLHVDTRSEGDGSARSIDSDDVLLNPEFSSESLPSTGTFTFNLKMLPHNVQEGWWLGTGYGQPSGQEIDILLAPPTEEWGIAQRHARIYINEQSSRFILDARHSVVLGENGKRKTLYAKSHILEDKDLLTIGTCGYTFEYTSAGLEVFHQQILNFIRDERVPVRGCPIPSSVGEPTRVGRYFCTPTIVGKGTFGKVFAGWSPKGTSVAIKQFSRPVGHVIRRHLEIMHQVGHHV